MGTDPGNNDFVVGAPCVFCTPGIFATDTPTYVQVVFTGIVKCPGKPNVPTGPFLLGQSGACSWSGIFAGAVSVTWRPGSALSNLFLNTGAGLYFAAGVLLPCATSYVNTQVVCFPPGPAGTGGIGEIFWGPTIQP